MDVTTVSNNYAQNASVRAPIDNSVAFREQNTQNQRAENERTQPRQSDSAQSQSSQQARQENEINKTSFVLEQDQDGAVLASSEGRSEDVSFESLDRDTPRGSFVDIFA